MKSKISFYTLSHAFIGLLLAAMVCITFLLIIEYRFFKEQGQKLVELQNDYQSYLQLFKEKLYNNKEDESGDSCDEESLDGESLLEDVSSELNVVNREFLYLRNSAINFGKVNNLEKMVNPCYELGNFEKDYTQAVRPRLTSPTASFIPEKKQKIRQEKVNFYPVDFTLSWPINRAQFWISSKFGPRNNGFHYGIDMAALKGTPVFAAMEGIVVEASYNPKAFGKSIVIDHKKCKTRYAHLNDMYVKVGQKVDRSKPIGSVGDTGLVRGKNDASHLHFEVIDLFGKRMNPLYILR